MPFHHPKARQFCEQVYLRRLADCHIKTGQNRRRVIEHEPAGLWRVSGCNPNDYSAAIFCFRVISLTVVS
ncbi:hypothetical protein KCP69_15730 [Salmonella enterica subsp. enterica]|nr:hypothetical protein KCP69_15730 [Salmonella enterica subsp. enterica]